MSGWELFTWLNVGVLAIGSLLVFGFFVRQLPSLLPPGKRGAPRPGSEASPE